MFSPPDSGSVHFSQKIGWDASLRPHFPS
jgi:hypothetical protein